MRSKPAISTAFSSCLILSWRAICSPVSAPPIPSSPPSPLPHGVLVLEPRRARLPLALICGTAAASVALASGLDAMPWIRLGAAAAVLLAAGAAAAVLGSPAPGERLELDGDGSARLVLAGHAIEARLQVAMAIGDRAWWLALDTAPGRRWIWIGKGSMRTGDWRSLCRILLQRRRVDANC